MKASIGHVGINLSRTEESFPFWKDLLQYLGFRFYEETACHFDASDGNSYLCVSLVEADFRKDGFHRKRTGLNHLAFRVDSPAMVDQFVAEFLLPRGIGTLYGGAKAYPEYAEGYYAVYFEDPDRIKVEVAFEPVLA